MDTFPLLIAKSDKDDDSISNVTRKALAKLKKKACSNYYICDSENYLVQYIKADKQTLWILVGILLGLVFLIILPTLIYLLYIKFRPHATEIEEQKKRKISDDSEESPLSNVFGVASKTASPQAIELNNVPQPNSLPKKSSHSKSKKSKSNRNKLGSKQLLPKLPLFSTNVVVGKN